MKIALVTTYLPPHPGGLERINENLLRGYGRAGQQVRCLTSRVPRELPRREGAIVRVPCFNAVEDRFGVPMPVWGPSALRELREIVGWAEVVHVVEALYLPTALAVAAARWAGKPVVVSQNVGFIPYRSRWLEAMERLAYATLGRAVLRAADHLVLATPTADLFVRKLLGHRLGRVSSFPIGIDTGMFRPASHDERARARAELGIPGDRPVVLFGARLVEKKGLPLVLAVAERTPEALFLVAGDGPMRGLLDTAGPNLRRLGQVDPQRMPDLYHAADAVLLPSRGEGLPVLVQEALGCGLPTVIPTDEIYAAALLAAGVCLGAPRDADEMAHRTRQALRSPPELGLRAREYVLCHWSLDATIARYLELMRELIDEVARANPRSSPAS